MIEDVTQLLTLELKSFCGLKTLSLSMGDVTQLQSMDSTSCSVLNELPEKLGDLKQLRFLSLTYFCSLKQLLTSVSKMMPDVLGCSRLEALLASAREK